MESWKIVGSDEKRLNDYKGYEIWKLWDIDYRGNKVNVLYQVSGDDDWAIDYFKTLKEAKAYIDNVLI